MKHLFRGCLWAFFACLILTANGYATSIVINPGATLAANADALAAFNRAAATWGGLFADPITVTIDADLAALGPGILGSTGSVFLATGYSTVRNQMVADAADEASNGIVASLPTAAQFSAFMPSGFGLSGGMAATKANLKALGFLGLDGAFGASDATIEFSSNFSFDFNNSDGVAAGTYDFETVAAHEIGHVLGFVSAVDEVDYYLSQGLTSNIFLEPLDLFRFGPLNPTAATFTTTPRSLLPGGSSFFDDGTNEWAFSTGTFAGDGRQASHWKDDALTGVRIGIMDPTLASGTVSSITGADLRALDVIGWDLAELNAVPEPSTLALLGTGLIAVMAGIERRRKK